MSDLVLVLVLVLVLDPPAFADRPLHGSASAGGTLLLTGDRGDRQRGELEIDLEPYSRFGGLVAWRGFDRGHHGLLCAGVMYEAGAARPRLVLAFHGDGCADLDQHAPALGGGVRATFTLLGPFGLGLDTGAYLVIDGVDNTRLALATGAALAASF